MTLSSSSLQALKNGALMALSFSVCFGAIAYAAISWPATPSGETAGGKYSTKLVPSGAIMAFNLVTCPSGWKAADGTNSTPDLRGEFLRWLDNGRDVDTGRILASSQNASTVFGAGSNPSPAYIVGNNWSIASNGTTNTSIWPHNLEKTYYTAHNGGYLVGFSNYTTGTTGIQLWQVRPRNVAFLYCIKD